jgi:hypothetical protein
MVCFFVIFLKRGAKLNTCLKLNKCLINIFYFFSREKRLRSGGIKNKKIAILLPDFLSSDL